MQITGGSLKSRKIDSPKGSNVRPTLSQVRESIFSVLFSLIDFNEKIFLDVFAGSVIMGFKAVSIGFQGSVFVEKDKKTFFQLKENAKKLGLDEKNTELFLGDSTKILKKLQKSFDVIYVDPPYQSGLYENILQIIFENKLLKAGGIVVLEHPKDLKFNPENYKTIKQKIYSDKCLSFLCFSNEHA